MQAVDSRQHWKRESGPFAVSLFLHLVAFLLIAPWVVLKSVPDSPEDAIEVEIELADPLPERAAKSTESRPTTVRAERASVSRAARTADPLPGQAATWAPPAPAANPARAAAESMVGTGTRAEAAPAPREVEGSRPAAPLLTAPSLAGESGGAAAPAELRQEAARAPGAAGALAAPMGAGSAPRLAAPPSEAQHAAPTLETATVWQQAAPVPRPASAEGSPRAMAPALSSHETALGRVQTQAPAETASAAAALARGMALATPVVGSPGDPRPATQSAGIQAAAGTQPAPEATADRLLAATSVAPAGVRPSGRAPASTPRPGTVQNDGQGAAAVPAESRGAGGRVVRAEPAIALSSAPAASRGGAQAGGAGVEGRIGSAAAQPEAPGAGLLARGVQEAARVRPTSDASMAQAVAAAQPMGGGAAPGEPAGFATPKPAATVPAARAAAATVAGSQVAAESGLRDAAAPVREPDRTVLASTAPTRVAQPVEERFSARAVTVDSPRSVCELPLLFAGFDRKPIPPGLDAIRATAAMLPDESPPRHLPGNQLPRYPVGALATRAEGRVLVRAEVQADGRVGRLWVKESSGAPVLDAAALETVRIWRFSPGQRHGMAVAMWLDVPIEYRLPQGETR